MRLKKLGGLKTISSNRILPIFEKQLQTLIEHKRKQKPNISLVASTKNGNFLMARNLR